MKKLIEYRNKAKYVAIGTAIAAVVLIIIYISVTDSAQQAYYETIAQFDSLYSYAEEELARANAGASIAMMLGALCSIVAGISTTLWMAANLLIAYRTPDDPEEN